MIPVWFVLYKQELFSGLHFKRIVVSISTDFEGSQDLYRKYSSFIMENGLYCEVWLRTADMPLMQAPHEDYTVDSMVEFSAIDIAPLYGDKNE